ncbi:hypothetical protein SynA1560_02214 [Synechococcus sp. A15-60]|nr:hypothetical protein SynA1560_02214 [Synechococcus sp. A15-60]
MIDDAGRLLMTSDGPAMHPETDSLSAEFAVFCSTKVQRNSEAAVHLNRVLQELIEASRAYRSSVIPGGSECHFGILAQAINELELVVNSAD